MRAYAENLSALYGQVRHAAQTLHAQATEIHELTQRLESLTKDALPVCRYEGQSGGEGGAAKGRRQQIAPLNSPANCVSYPASMIPR
jgi:hypothetical protein